MNKNELSDELIGGIIFARDLAGLMRLSNDLYPFEITSLINSELVRILNQIRMINGWESIPADTILVDIISLGNILMIKPTSIKSLVILSNIVDYKNYPSLTDDEFSYNNFLVTLKEDSNKIYLKVVEDVLKKGSEPNV